MLGADNIGFDSYIYWFQGFIFYFYECICGMRKFNYYDFFVGLDFTTIFINIQILIIEILIISFSAWRFVLYACPWIATSNSKDIKEKT
jgi:hypothetical protein